MAGTDSSASHVEVDQDGSVVAFAEVDRPEGGDTARAALHVEAGHRPPDTGTRLVDAVLDTPQVREAAAVVAALPRGEADALQHVQDRLPSSTTRTAGATVIVEGQVPKAGSDDAGR
jgi:hypothetical protein